MLSRNSIMRFVLVALSLAIATPTFAGVKNESSSAKMAIEPDVNIYLTDGKIDEGIKAFETHLESNPDDVNARAGLGLIQFVDAIENLGRSVYRFGGRSSEVEDMFGGGVPVLRIPVPENPKPEVVHYEDVRQILQALIDDLETAETTLAMIGKTPVKVKLEFGRFRLDLDGDGMAADEESLWSIYAQLNENAGRVPRSRVEEIVVGMDLADVHWLRGYCHLISAMCEFMLAYDFEETFNVGAHTVFSKPDPVHEILVADEGFVGTILDWASMVHTIRWPLTDGERMSVAHAHLLEVIRHSRITWELIVTEMDDDHEWIPNPDQTSIFRGVEITDEMVTTWLQFVDEAENVLLGKQLVPFWAINDSPQGVNLQRVFLEPREFDAILWVAGTAALPYVEDGELSDPATWQRFQRVFGGEFIGFAIWFN